MAGELPVRDVPTTVVTGFLGVGKTTAILDLLEGRAGNERWAVLVNEFGEIGIDGVALDDVGGLGVREVRGGCICCSAGLPMRIALVRLLREIRPDRLIIEPTGLAHPASILDTLRYPGLREAVRPMAVIGLVDPRALDDPRIAADDTFVDQAQIADVLVANRCDQASQAQLERFRAWAGGLFPPKVVVGFTRNGVLDPAWLDLDPVPREVSRHAHVHGHAEVADLRPEPDAAKIEVPERREAEAGSVATCGWVFPRTAVFQRDALEDALHELVRPNPALPAGALRLKGVFRTPRVWLLANASADAVQWRPLNYRRDSRVEVIAPADPAPDWDRVEARLRRAATS